MKTFFVRTITGIIFVAAIVASFLRPEAMVLLFSIVTGLTIWEFTGLVNEREDVTVNRFISTVAGVYFFFAMTYFCSDLYGGAAKSVVFIPYLVTIVYLLVAELYLKQPDPIQDWAYTMLAQMYIALPFSLLNVLAFTATNNGLVMFNTLLPLSVFVFLWVNDSGAYCIGSLLGRHKLFPRISPGKSWEGSIGGAVFVLAAAYAISYFLDGSMLTMPQWMGLGLVVVVFGTWGDLVESLFKRTLGIKDSGNILPGHGGMLDRFDSSLLAIPAAVVYLYTLSLF
ncbi:MAG: phosphatidate cytidylyltransferase [Prevotella sp.]|nr:phosphatidate cytidylyltransferase [Prevotella sp.]MDE7086047.1 phosphatidate cytidylyltransferase [Prevotella sp.]MDE7456749.1 phosphatidate cytidylyltransferase [Prevotella sp.]